MIQLRPSRREWLGHALSGVGLGLLGACASKPPQALVLEGNLQEQLQRSNWAGWEERHFPTKRPTQYRLVHEGGSQFAVQATAKESASMLRKRVHVPAEHLGHVRFSWKAERISEASDIGDFDATDAVVRVLLGFDGDRDRWSSRDSMLNEMSRLLMGEDMPFATLVYAWCALGEKDSVVFNPRTRTVRNLLLETGSAAQGQWLSYRRNIREDFMRAFGEAPGALTSIAVMTDSDNTRSHAVGWYRPVELEVD